jgi:hypothetical protein
MQNVVQILPSDRLADRCWYEEIDLALRYHTNMILLLKES